MTETRKTHLDAVAMVLLIVCCAFWGFQQVLVKATLPELPPVFQTAVRFIGATLLLMVWARLRGVVLFQADGHGRAGLVCGALFALEFALMYVGMQFTSASRLTLFLYTSPFVVALLVPMFVKSERLAPVQWLGLACAFFAVAFALSDQRTANASPKQLWGDALALAAGLAWGLTTVVIRVRGVSSVGAEKLLFYQVGVSALVLPVLSFALGEPWPSRVSAFAWMSLALQTVIGAFATYLIWMWLLGRYPATKLSSFVFLAPLFALVFGAWWLNEPITRNLVIALALVALGILMVNRTSRRP
jgi:drug/metabolite transporter (DMT)-like permease